MLSSPSPTAQDLAAALGTGSEPRVVLVDDADLLILPEIDQDLRALVESGRDRGVGVAAAVTGETMAGAMGWLSALKRHRRGVLLDPQSVMEGDILGVRLTHAQLRNRRPGRGLTVDPRSGELISVQIPETDLG
jgi:S-DNA-T family DNA segregation ATPase FtsK/SpoIIIE